MAAVREHLATCPESHEEFETLGGVVPYLAESPDIELVEPPAALRDRIMAAAAADLAARSDAPALPQAREPAAAPPIAFPSATEREARARSQTGRIGWAMRIAAVVAIVALGGWNLLLQSDLSAARRFDQAVQRVITAAAQPGSQTVVLTPTENNQASGLAAIRPDGSVVLAMRNLPTTNGARGLRDVGHRRRRGAGPGRRLQGRCERDGDRHDSPDPGAAWRDHRRLARAGARQHGARRPDRVDWSRTGPVELTVVSAGGGLERASTFGPGSGGSLSGGGHD